MFYGRFLRVIKKSRTLELDDIVFCFVDEGFQFRVRTQRPVRGVHEVIFSHEDRYKFEIYS